MAKTFRVTIDPRRCKQCAICAELCPHSCFTPPSSPDSKPTHTGTDLSAGPPELLRPSDCTGCRTCEILCPDIAVDVEEVVPCPGA